MTDAHRIIRIKFNTVSISRNNLDGKCVCSRTATADTFPKLEVIGPVIRCAVVTGYIDMDILA